MRLKSQPIVMGLYLLFLLVPIYWLVNMSLKTNTEITSSFTLWPENLTFANYVTILTDPSWYMGYVNSLIYVVMNTVISITVALPAGTGTQSETETWHFTERVAGTLQLGGSERFAATFELEQPLLDALWRVTYAARDGLEIEGFVTVPRAAGNSSQTLRPSRPSRLRPSNTSAWLLR